MIVYLATNKANGKRYVGLTKYTLDHRMRTHGYAAKHRQNAPAFIRALRKYGVDGFLWEVLAECSSVAEMKAAEVQFIAHYDSRAEGGRGYNRTAGGDGTHIVDDAIKAKLRAANLGKRASEATRAKMRAAQVIVNSTPDRREACRARFLGSKRTPSQAAKISAALTGKKHTPATRERISRAQERKRKVPTQDEMGVVLRLTAGESMRSIAGEYGCSHEIISRLAAAYGVRSKRGRHDRVRVAP